jgi:hypothetical protein
VAQRVHRKKPDRNYGFGKLARVATEKKERSNANYEKYSLASNTAYGYIRGIRPRIENVYANHFIFGDERCLRAR